MAKTVTIDRQSNGGVIITVNGGFPRGIDNANDLVVKPIENYTGCVIKSNDQDFRLKLFLVDTITINGTLFLGSLSDLINLMLNWVFGGSTTYAVPSTKLPQTITLTAPPADVHTGPPATLNGTTNSGLTIAYTSSNTAIFTIAGNVLTKVGAGTANIIANQAGNAQYAAAAQVTVPYTLS